MMKAPVASVIMTFSGLTTDLSGMIQPVVAKPVARDEVDSDIRSIMK